MLSAHFKKAARNTVIAAGYAGLAIGGGAAAVYGVHQVVDLGFKAAAYVQSETARLIAPAPYRR